MMSLVAELKDKVERLRSIRERKREIDWSSYTLPTLRETQQESKEPRSSCHLAEGGDPVDGGGM